MKASCVCGQVTVEVPRPEYVNFCDCSLCARVGATWSYYPVADVRVSGETRAYTREDRPDPAIAVQFCPSCGSTIRWTLLPGDKRDLTGVNMRLFDPDELAGIEARFMDGRSWDGKSKAGARRPPGALGVDAFF
ncbi:GFA family protein [Altererythrobacter sp.]|uniref:GFA family protein n=1 Tax=Altererythrobacter sp. TaxID=1872480 RepID=UPI003D08CFEE